MPIQPLVSVIIPVYNVERYLDACIESIRDQSYTNIEIILVDDGSTDKSGKKCDTWEKRDERISVIHKNNEGLNFARKDGFKASSGEYLIFLDSDDLLHRDSVTIFMSVLQAYRADAVVAGSQEFTDKSERDKIFVPEEQAEVRVLDTKSKIVKYSILGKPDFPDSTYMTAWGKIYSRDIIQGADWAASNFRSYEDNFWTPSVLIQAKRVALLANKLHYYRRNIQYGSEGNTLGTRLIGNSFNGQPVGFMEYLELLHQFFKELTKKRGVNIDSELEELHYRQSWSRLNVLVQTGLLNKENNLDYLKDIWNLHMQRDWRCEQEMDELKDDMREKISEIEHLQGELEKFTGIKFSARHLKNIIKQRLTK